jgi:REP element-mobilizing transposase RayT
VLHEAPAKQNVDNASSPEFRSPLSYFLTTTAAKHAHIFKREPVIRIILDSLHFIRTNKGIKLFVFVVMPNHIHLIVQFPEIYTPSDMMRDFKRHTARQIIRQFQVEERMKELGVLQRSNEDQDQEYKVWEEGYDARDIFSQKFLSQKMEYIHYNPCQPQWKLAGAPEEYPWSSARFYVLDKPSVIPVDDVWELFR